MRITIIGPIASFGGGTRVLGMHAHELLRRGHEVFLLTQPWPKPRLGARVRALVKQGKWLRRPPPRSLFDELGIRHVVLSEQRPVCDRDVPDADVVIATWWETAEWVMRLSDRKGKKAYFVQGHETFEGQPIERVKATYRLPMRKLVVSEWLATLMRSEYGNREVDLIPNAVDTDLFSTPARSKAAVPRVGMIYAEGHCKGADVGVRALTLLKAQRPDVQLLVVSSEALPASVELPPDTEVHRRPRQIELRDLYAACDAWLVPSREEGFGLPILEAMACHTPVVATPAGAAPELIRPENGRLAQMEDVADICRCLREIIELDASRWVQMSLAARSRALGYGWADATARLEAALAAVVTSSREQSASERAVP